MFRVSLAILRVALVHDYLNQYGGAERVLEAFSEIFPLAPIYTLFYDERLTRGVFRGKDIRTSFLQKIPFSRKYHQLFPALMPIAVESLDLSNFDLVLSDSASFAKGVLTKPNTLHICYLHTPLRYAWDKSHEYLSEFPVPSILKLFAPPLLTYLRIWDKEASTRPDVYITNSKFVQRRIRKYYGKDAEVIYPPVDVKIFDSENSQINAGEGYFIMVGRLTPYKRFQLAIEVFNRLGWKLKIIGDGPEKKRLKKIARSNIEFLGIVSDELLKKYYANSKALVFPQEEDFGIVPLEAMSAGKPVIAFSGGGALESVRENETGIFFNEQTQKSLKDALYKFNPSNFGAARIKEHARSFDKEVFKGKIKAFIEREYEDFRKAY